MCWKEIFPSEDATRFDFVDELYTLPAKLPTSMFQFAAWIEDWMTKLVVAEGQPSLSLLSQTRWMQEWR